VGAQGRKLPAVLSDPSARTLVAGELEAVFLPGYGMLGASLRHRGVELLRRVEDLEDAAANGRTAGIPLLHPWANRIEGLRYRAAGQTAELVSSSPLLHLDGNGLPIHGVPWSMLAWDVTDAAQDRVAARLEWTRSDLLAVFPFRHRLEMTVNLAPDAMTLETTLVASSDGAVPVCFGFHPYMGLPELPRDQWRLTLPAMRRLTLDPRGIPTGEEESFRGMDASLGGLDLDDAFAVIDERTALAIAGGGRRISVEFLAGYRCAQVFAPKGEDCVALEPMTAPPNALVSGRGLRLIEPGGRFHATFRIRIDAR
jgi:aldose 1-epimerase